MCANVHKELTCFTWSNYRYEAGLSESPHYIPLTVYTYGCNMQIPTVTLWHRFQLRQATELKMCLEW